MTTTAEPAVRPMKKDGEDSAEKNLMSMILNTAYVLQNICFQQILHCLLQQ